MKKEYEALSVDVVKFEAQDVITLSAPEKNEDSATGGDKEIIADR